MQLVVFWYFWFIYTGFVVYIDSHLQIEHFNQKMDPEDTWLAVGAGISVGFLALCWCGCLLRDYLRRPRIKASRSDNDLAQLNAEAEEV